MHSFLLAVDNERGSAVLAAAPHTPGPGILTYPLCPIKLPLPERGNKDRTTLRGLLVSTE